MRDYDFVARLLEWLEMPGEGEPYPHDAGPHPADPRDARFDCLCTLYLEADEAQRAQIAALFARDAEQSTRAHSRIAHWVAARGRARDYLSNLILYMRRLSSSMGSGNDATWRLRLGLAAAALLQEREDYRDVMVSLAYLHHAARQAGIDPDPHFREVGGSGEARDGGGHARLSGAGRSRDRGNGRSLLVTGRSKVTPKSRPVPGLRGGHGLLPVPSRQRSHHRLGSVLAGHPPQVEPACIPAYACTAEGARRGPLARGD